MAALKDRNLTFAQLKAEIEAFIKILGDDVDVPTKHTIELCFFYKFRFQISRKKNKLSNAWKASQINKISNLRKEI